MEQFANPISEQVREVVEAVVEAAAYLESEQKKWGRVIKERGIKAE